jgi:hypothetical protein
MLSLCKEELKARYCGSATLDYLRERTLADMKLCGNASRSIWDVAPVAWLLDETPFISETLPPPRLELDGSEHKQENAPLYRRIASLQRDPIMEQLLSVLKRAQ